MIHKITLPTPFDVGPVNTYLLAGPEPALVDTGPRGSRTMELLRQGLAAAGYAVADLRWIVVTHAHADHFGLTAQIVAESGARVITHRRNLHTLSDFGNEWTRRHDFYAQVFAESGLPAEMREAVRVAGNATARYAEAAPVDRLVDEGDMLELGGESWQVLHTPGHTGGQICLYQPDSRTLLSSDHLLKSITSNPLLEPPEREETERRHSLTEYLVSLRRVAEMDVAEALPGHGEPIRDHRELIAARFGFHQERQERILALLDGGGRTAHAVALGLWPGLTPLNTFLALSEVIGHMDVLEEEGRVGVTRRDGLLLYQRS